MSIRKMFVEPGHFYSPIPDQSEVELYLDSDQFQRQKARVDAMLDYGAMADLWRTIAPKAVSFPFEASRDFRYYGRNGQFLYFDATVLSAMLTMLNPRKVVEIGCGYSSAAMFDTFDRLDGARLESFVCIDPDMSRLDKLNPPNFVTRLEAKVQSCNLNVFSDLSDGDLLFIDSSHVLKTGSDLHFEYLELLPRLGKGTIVHIHDVFYPFEYPPEWLLKDGRAWNEVYLVDLMLSHGTSWEVVFFNHAMIENAPDVFETSPSVWKRFNEFSVPKWQRSIMAGSIWLRKRF